MDTFNRACWDSFPFVLNLTLLLAPAPELVSKSLWRVSKSLGRYSTLEPLHRADTAPWSPCMGQMRCPGELAWGR